METIRVFLVDDHAMIRGSLAHALSEAEDIEVIGQAESGEIALEKIARLTPDVVVLDYSMPDMDGTSVALRMKEQGSRARVLFLTMHDNVSYAKAAIDAGAHGFLIKNDDVDDLISGIRVVHHGGRFVSRSLESELGALLASPKSRRSGLDALSRREFELLRHLGGGLTLQEASHAMGDISESTASTYRSRLMKKLGLDNTAQIIRFALENQVVQ
ncbi:MAG: DNA-binding response regulator [Planctomycetota bacterium]|nr:MAG: DNA-binding response regulator [Planctomycetota bacterium]